jgi:serine/alanine racemase
MKSTWTDTSGDTRKRTINVNKSHSYTGIDTFRVVCALYAVGAHTYPLLIISEELNHIAFHIFARIVVPFFLMVTGFFLIPKYTSNFEKKPVLPVGFFKKTALLYAGASLLYLPVAIYAGYYSSDNIFISILRNIIFDGTFYHLWYLPALMIGALILYFLARVFTFRAVMGITIFLYVLGMLGDSYYGLTANIPVLNTIYNAGFQVFSYTRNGIFLAPVFLAMGGMLAHPKLRTGSKTNIIGLIVSMLLMLVEGLVLDAYNLPRHDSMYIFLLPCMYFLFQTILQHNKRNKPVNNLRRDIAMYIFILHPLVIVAVRGGARVIGLSNLLVDNNMVLFFAVSLISILFSIAVIEVHKYIKKLRHSGLDPESRG